MFDDPSNFDGFPDQTTDLYALADAVRRANFVIRPLAGTGIPWLDGAIAFDGEPWVIMRTVKLPQGFHVASVYSAHREHGGWLALETVQPPPKDLRRACLFASKTEAAQALLKLWEADEAAPHVGVVVTIKRGGLTMLRAPLFTCPTQFVLAFEAGDDFGVYVQSEALNLQQPAHIVCYLSGLIRVE